MLNKLLPNQISAYWDSLKHGLEQSCPSDSFVDGESLNKCLIALMSGNLQAWFATTRVDNKIEYHGNLITKILTDDITGRKSLLLVSLYLFKQAPQEIWIDAFETLRKFAVANDCKKITAYTTNPAVLKRATQFNFNTDWSILSLEI